MVRPFKELLFKYGDHSEMRYGLSRRYKNNKLEVASSELERLVRAVEKAALHLSHVHAHN